MSTGEGNDQAAAPMGQGAETRPDPVVCTCGREFSPLPSNITHCPDCGAGLSPELLPALGLTELVPSESKAQPVPEDNVPEEWKPGDVYLDRYRVEKLLGQGAMGKVFKVLHLGWNQHLAVKCPRQETVQAFGGAHCFEQEVETWIRVGLHPNAVACYYSRTLGGLPRVFAEYVDGGTLHEWIQKRRLYQGGPRDTLRQVLLVAAQIAWGLHHANRKGVIHQDVKPANIMMTCTGIPKVTDFGLARRALPTEGGGWEATAMSPVTITGMTPAYCSPEQSFRDQITHRTDIWSWGLVVLEMFISRMIWANGPAALEAMERYLAGDVIFPDAPRMPEEVASLLRQCFQNNPAERPEDLAACAAEVVRIYEATLEEPFPVPEPAALEATGNTLNNRAISLMDFGKAQQAIKVWERALREAPGHPQSAFNYSLVRWREGSLRDDEAVAMVRAAAESRPDEPLPVFLELRLHLERGAIADARECLRKLEAIAPGMEGLATLRESIERDLSRGRGMTRLWEAHQGATTALALCESLERLFSGGEDNRVLQWDILNGAPMTALDGHHNTIAALAHSPLRGQLASISLDRRVRIWDADTHEVRCSHNVSSVRPRVLAWLQDRGTLLLADADGSLHEIDPGEGQRQELLARVPGGIRAFAVSPAAGLAFAAAPGGNIHLLSLVDFQETARFQFHSSEITALAASPDGGFFASGDEGGALMVTDASGAHVAAFQLKGESVVSCAFLGGARYLFSISSGKKARLWHVDKHRCLWTMPLPAAPLPALETSPDGATAWAAIGGNRIAQLQLSPAQEFDRSPLIISKAMDTGEMVALERELRARLADASEHYREGRYAQTASTLRGVREKPEFSRRRDILRSWMRLYAKLPRTALRSMWEGEPLLGHHGPVRALALSLQSNYLVSGGNDCVIRVWDLNTNQLIRQLGGHAGPVRTLALAESQELLISGSEDGSLRIWNVRTGRCERAMPHPGGAPEALSLSPDGAMLVSAGWEVHLWDLRGGSRIAALPGHEGGSSAVAWARSGSYVVSGGADARIAFWDPATGAQLAARACPHGPVTALSLSAYENVMLSTGGNPWDRKGKVCVWDLTKGEPARVFEAHDAPVGMACLSLDGRLIFSGAGDATLQIHHAATGEAARSQLLGGVPPVAMVLANDLSRVLWSDADGVIRCLFLDWELASQEVKAELDAPGARLFDIFARGMRPLVAQQAEAAARAWPVARASVPRWDSRALQRFNYLSGCAGLGTYRMAALEAAQKRFMEAPASG